MKHPEYMINLLTTDDKKGLSRASEDYQISKQEASKWHSYISLLIKQAEEFEGDAEEIVINNKELSVKEEIKKLRELLDQEAITYEEFKKERRKLLL